MAAASGAVYLAALWGATTLAFGGASLLRRALSSKEFKAALRAAQHPVTKADLPRLLPGIAIYPGAKISPFAFGLKAPEGGSGPVVVSFLTSADGAKIADFYRTHMPGWTLNEAGQILAFSRGAEGCVINITRNPWPAPGARKQYMFTISYNPGKGTGK